MASPTRRIRHFALDATGLSSTQIVWLPGLLQSRLTNPSDCGVSYWSQGRSQPWLGFSATVSVPAIDTDLTAAVSLPPYEFDNLSCFWHNVVASGCNNRVGQYRRIQSR